MAKGNVKDPASHTQRVCARLSFQTGKRYIETLTFREFKRIRSEMGYDASGAPYINKDTDEYSILNETDLLNNPHGDNDISIGGTRFSICIDFDQPDNRHEITIKWMGKGQPILRTFDVSLVQSLGRRLFLQKMVVLYRTLKYLASHL
mmetsp:Transcript_11173/g.20914  ORF Transcript_11173/g.20914 Transcript_11173/m.20914 type:complete len:148 (-) Transcript_11173:682-1125(-)